MRRRTRLRQYGASMLEVLVALLVMSLGLLGMAGLQAATTKYRVNVQSHAAVAQLVSELSERMRINPDATGPEFDPSMGGGSSLYTLEKTWAVQSAATLEGAKNCLSSSCSAQERADFDMLGWRQRVRDLLPQGRAMVQGDRRSGIRVTLMWMDKEQTAEIEDADTGIKEQALSKAPVCTVDADSTIVHNCCPAEAAVPAGVRCLRMSFLP